MHTQYLEGCRMGKLWGKKVYKDHLPQILYYSYPSSCSYCIYDNYFIFLKEFFPYGFEFCFREFGFLKKDYEWLFTFYSSFYKTYLQGAVTTSYVPRCDLHLKNTWVQRWGLHLWLDTTSRLLYLPLLVGFTAHCCVFLSSLFFLSFSHQGPWNIMSLFLGA